jgi:SAM-dependent methyltransferase
MFLTVEIFTTAKFDKYAADYERQLQRGLALTGESKEYFLEARTSWLAKCLRALSEHPQRIMDFGCGGSGTESLLFILRPEAIIGVDRSPKLLESARENCKSPRAQFLLTHNYEPSDRIDLVYCNGVFHHIAPEQRLETLDYIWRALRPGGLFALWENNSWNPGTRFVMSRIPFDQDAILLSSTKTRQLLRARGFEIVRTDYLFVFPNFLKYFRPIEPLLTKLPLGGQFQVLCRKP